MKKIFAILASALLASSALFAQDYTRLQVSYAAHTLTNIDDINPKGFTVGGVAGFSVSDALPIYFEPGVNLTFAHSAEDVLGGEVKFNYMNVAVPVNGVYKYELNDKISFSGYAGLNFKVNLLAKYKEEIGGSKDSFSMLDKDDMGSRKDRANIFQLGCQLGLGVHISNLYIGYQFQPDLMKFQKFEAEDDAHRWITNCITVGWTL